MKKKKILISIICVVVLWGIVGIFDFVMVHSYRKPFFCVGKELADDGGSGKYVGLGYSFDIEGGFMPESENLGVTSFRGYILGYEVSRGSLEKMLPNSELDLMGTKNCGETVPNNPVLKSPPVLTVVCNKESIEALRGTTSWRYQKEDGTEIGINSDSMHPLQAKAYMTPLKLISTPDMAKVYLKWDVMPDEVTVHCWREKYWGSYDAKSEEIPVIILEKDYAGSNYETNFVIELKNRNYIYEVIAEWNSAEKYEGTVYYSFYTVINN